MTSHAGGGRPGKAARIRSAASAASFFEDEETSDAWTGKTKKPRLCPSQHLDGEAGVPLQDDQDEQHCSDSMIIDADADSMIIDAQATEDRRQRRQEQGGGGRGGVQALLALDLDTIAEKIFDCSRQLNHEPPEVHPDYMCPYDQEQLNEVYERLALCRIVRGYDDEVSEDRELAELDDEALKLMYPPDVLCDEWYFRRYEESLDWYFDDDLCKYAGLEDYQRLVLRSYGEYHYWNRYSSTRNTYEEDLAYVQSCEAIENETKWIEDYLLDSTLPWEKVQSVACVQALKIAAGLAHVSTSLVFSGFEEHMWSVKFDFKHKGLDAVYFEIWKRVAKQKMDFREALSEVYNGKMFPSRSLEIELELDKPTRSIFSMKDKYNAYVACIDDLVSEDAARPLITEAVKKMNSKPKTYVDYARKKLDIAQEIGLIAKA